MKARSIVTFLFNILFPPQCVVCRKKMQSEDEFDGLTASRFTCICETCFATIEIASGFSCPACGRRLYAPKSRCHRQEKFILAAATSYGNPAARELIHALKYQYLKVAASPLAWVLRAYLEKMSENLPEKIDDFVIVPIPLHKRRERERGFNQSLLIAEKLMESLGEKAPALDEGNLIRVKNTKSQIQQASYAERRANIEGCFALRRAGDMRGKNILLLDDVFTSGATMREAARALKQAGARKIIALVVAKA